MFADLSQALEMSGLLLRGGFSPEASDSVPLTPDGREVRTLVLVGNAGPAMWSRFSQEKPDGSDSLDSWCEIQLTKIAERFGAHVIFPFQKPYFPFQRWLMRAEPCYASPLGILIHPRYGLWHAVRGALLFTQHIELGEMPTERNPCEICADKPCLSTCPVTAFSNTGYDVPRCVVHLRSPSGDDCMALGCRARRACPVGMFFRDAPGQAAFHMAAFLAAFGG